MNLPDEVWVEIFSFVKASDLCRLSLVNSAFNRRASDGVLWRLLTYRYTAGKSWLSDAEKPAHRSWKDWYACVIQLPPLDTAVSSYSQTHTDVTEFPLKALWIARTLKQLHLADNKISLIPPEVRRFTVLHTLNVNSNRLATLPAEISKLKTLTHLSARDNLITGLPSELGHLPGLVTLDLSANQLATVPFELCYLTALTSLNLDKNPLTGGVMTAYTGGSPAPVMDFLMANAPRKVLRRMPIKVAQTLQNLDVLVSNLNPTEDLDDLLDAVTYIRQLSALIDHPPLQAIIEAQAVAPLVNLLDSPHYAAQYNAMWALANIASGDSSQVQVLVEKGIIPHMVRLVSDPKAPVELRDITLWACGNIGGDCNMYKCMLLDAAVVTGVAELITQLTPPKDTVWKVITRDPEDVFTETKRLEFLGNAAWVLSNLFQNPLSAEHWNVWVVPSFATLKRIAENVKHEDNVIDYVALTFSRLVTDKTKTDRLNAVMDYFHDLFSSGWMLRVARHPVAGISRSAFILMDNLIFGCDAAKKACCTPGHPFLIACTEVYMTATQHRRMTAIQNAVSSERDARVIVDTGVLPRLYELSEKGRTDAQPVYFGALLHVLSFLPASEYIGVASKLQKTAARLHGHLPATWDVISAALTDELDTEESGAEYPPVFPGPQDMVESDPRQEWLTKLKEDAVPPQKEATVESGPEDVAVPANPQWGRAAAPADGALEWPAQADAAPTPPVADETSSLEIQLRKALAGVLHGFLRGDELRDLNVMINRPDSEDARAAIEGILMAYSAEGDTGDTADSFVRLVKMWRASPTSATAQASSSGTT